MSLDAKQLIAAIPIDIDESQESSQQTLEKLLTSLAQKPVPVSRLTRMWALGSMQAKIAVAYFARINFGEIYRAESRVKSPHR